MSVIFKTKQLTEELLQEKIEVIDLPPIRDLLEDIDSELLKEFDNNYNVQSLNKVRVLRKQVAKKIKKRK